MLAVTSGAKHISIKPHVQVNRPLLLWQERKNLQRWSAVLSSLGTRHLEYKNQSPEVATEISGSASTEECSAADAWTTWQI